MTEIILGARDEQPAICGCCSRIASPVGVMHPIGQHVLWLCEICTTKNGMKVADMNPTKLVETEAKALDAAAALTINDVIPAVFEILWGEGIRDLEAMNGDNYPVILQKIAAAPEYREAMRKTFLAYAAAIRTDLTNIRE